ncbi:hypothetical protein [Larkinella punicea]|uniref:ZU5 domain-containing protein n=1 Tax=Larkinella punicea TaxID=2315727 RepID=A0A368JNP1_9BACT|nr:hypothetical protein [Larkinella punicea]RCR68636.1 hypothetical protein DUE52_16140 [Larkinella punicea]
MNRLFIYFLSLALTAVSCKHDTDKIRPDGPGNTQPEPPPSIPLEEAVTPVGTPEGNIITATIGPAGGTVASEDQRIRVVIPAGALSSPQTISVQPLTNTCPSGTGQAFRLTPHGLTFAKPATIAFHYDENDLQGTAQEALRIAYQADNGSWKSPGRRSLDTTARLLSVQTTHFSDWTFFKNITMEPVSAVVEPGGTIDLKVYQHVEEPETGGDDELTVPKVPALIKAKYIKKWAVSSEGTLAHEQVRASYYAPSKIPAKNPVTVTVFLNLKVTIDGLVYNDLRLVSSILVAPEGISVQIDGGEWKTYTGGIGVDPGTSIMLGNNGDEKCGLAFPGTKPGTFRWTLGTEVVFNLHKGYIIYQHVYAEDKKPVVSGGSLKVISIDANWVTGTFDVNPSGWIQPNNPYNPIGRASIKGVFRLRRVN